jgi:hypothetical protein
MPGPPFRFAVREGNGFGQACWQCACSYGFDTPALHVLHKSSVVSKVCGGVRACQRKPVLFRSLWSGVLFLLGRIVEQDGQLDAAVAKLWEEWRRTIPRIQIGGGIVRREEHQRIEKG